MTWFDPTVEALKNERDFPLVSHVAKGAEHIGFHMPGHRAGAGFSAAFRALLPVLDTTELAETGDLNDPTGAVETALTRAAAFYGAGRTLFVTGGTTTALRIAIAAAFRPGDRVLIARGSHLSAVHAFALLGLEPVFITHEAPPAFPDGQPTEAEVLCALDRHPDVAGVVLTTPGYYGETLPLSRIADRLHRRGRRLVVDEAHGAHFALDRACGSARDLPPTALSMGADLVAQSAHKTLPALTPAAMIHVSHDALATGRIAYDRLLGFLPVFQTSSPSFPIAASLDYARAFAEQAGAEALEDLLGQLDDLTEALPPGLVRVLPEGADPTRLVLDYRRTGLQRSDVTAVLTEHGVAAEMADLMRLVLIVPFGTPPDAFLTLLNALNDMARRGTGREDSEAIELERARARMFLRPYRPERDLRTALLDGERVTAVYPPGVALRWPGERADRDLAALCAKLYARGLVLRGACF